MACLRESSYSGRSRTLQCDEEGCEYRRVETGRSEGLVSYASPADCVLQLRLRAGDAEDIDLNEVKWRGEPWPKIELSESGDESLLSYEPIIRRAITEQVDREDRLAIENYLGLKLDDYQWHLFKLLLGRNRK